MKSTLKKVGFCLSVFAVTASPILSGVSAYATTGGDGVLLEAGEFSCSTGTVIGGSGTWTLTDSTDTCDITVQNDADAVIDLNGKTISSTNNRIIKVVKGSKLTLKNGEIKSATKDANIIYNNGTFVLDGATVTKDDQPYGYAVLNHGEMIFESGTVQNTTDYEGEGLLTNTKIASLIENGYYDYVKKDSLGSDAPSLTINGGTYIGGMNTVKNDEGGTIVINDGEFKNTVQYSLQNWNVGTINGGNFSTIAGKNKTAVMIGAYNAYCKGDLTIKGGTFDADYLIQGYSAQYIKGTSLTISGGDFTKLAKGIINTNGGKTDLAGENGADIKISGGKFAVASEKAETELGEVSVVEASQDNNDKAASIFADNLVDILNGEPDANGIVSAENFKFKITNSNFTLSDILSGEISAEVTTESLTDEYLNSSEATNEQSAEYGFLGSYMQSEFDGIFDPDKDADVISYFDITIGVNVNDAKIGEFTETPEKLSFTIDIPEDYWNNTTDMDYTYYIVRAHGTEVETVAEAKNVNQVTFESDKFSTYALAYVASAKTTSTTTTTTSSNSDDSSAGTPNTGALSEEVSASVKNKNYAPYISAMIICFAVYGFLMRKLVFKR